VAWCLLYRSCVVCLECLNLTIFSFCVSFALFLYCVDVVYCVLMASGVDIRAVTELCLSVVVILLSIVCCIGWSFVGLADTQYGRSEPMQNHAWLWRRAHI